MATVAQASPVLRIEMDPAPDARWNGADLALFIVVGDQPYRPGDVRTILAQGACDGPEPTGHIPTWLEPQIKANDAPNARSLLGNAGCELTYRHIHCDNAAPNVAAMIDWAEWAFRLVGERLVLAPMDFDLIHDVMTGARLLRWAAEHKVVLVIFCGYRFLFKEDAFDHIREMSERYPFSAFGNPYRYPFAEVRDAIKASGAEVWTGAGFVDGLRSGALDRAKDFGFRGVLTAKEAWIAGLMP